VTFAFWGVGTFIPTYVAGVAAKAGLSGPAWAGWAGLITRVCGTLGFVSLGFLADAIGRKPTAMLWYTMCLVLTPLVYLWGASWGFVPLLVLVGIFGFFTLGIWAWAPVWLPELFPTRMRGTAVAFCFNAPRFISCLGPLIAGTLIAYFGGFGPAATIVGLFFILGVVAARSCPRPTASRCRTRCGKRLGRHRRRPRHSSAQHQPHSGYASSNQRSRLTRAVGPCRPPHASRLCNSHFALRQEHCHACRRGPI